jgi:uncharacterized protein (UPF0303 family)
MPSTATASNQDSPPRVRRKTRTARRTDHSATRTTMLTTNITAAVKTTTSMETSLG